MLSNIVDVDEQMVVVAMQEEQGAAVFSDFAAAFPSVSHEFMLDLFAEMGLPEGLLRFVRILYARNRCSISIAGGRYA
eukprot:5443818-Lingulodinium_polyedra.AAC.1